MDKTLLHVLSPQLQSLVEASLGEALPGQSQASPQRQQQPLETAALLAAPHYHISGQQKQSQRDAHSTVSTIERNGAAAAVAAVTNSTSTTPLTSSVPLEVKLNPSELFVLQHAESPGFVVKEHLIGTESALAARDALVSLTQTEQLRDARVGHGEHVRNERAVRGDRILWIQRPRDLRDSVLHPAIAHLLRRIESIAFGVKAALAPALDIRNVTSTQLAIFPGDGSRFVRHTDTYSSAHQDDAHQTASSSSGLVRLVTCVYYLNRDWQPAHAGQLRVFVNKSSSSSSSTTASHWDVAPTLDTLVVFRSLDVEHEVLPTFHERMALTVWYYGRVANADPQRSVQQPREDPLALVKSLLLATPSAPAPTPPSGAVAAPSAAASTFATATSTKTDTDTGTDANSLSDTIFVAIPSYRDPECRHTVDDLLRKASDPSRVRVGICLQLGEDDDDPRAHFAETYAPQQVRVTWLDYRNAAGPCVARAEAQKLWRGEAFYLQIDSHMRFRAGWDAYLLAQLRKCPSAKPILTTYPLGYTLPNTVSSDIRPTLLCAAGFDDHGMLRQASKTLTATSPEPIPSSFWAAGFAFSSAHVVQDVPYDASLRFLFFGEEASMSARLWTSGWDFFAPGKSVVYHLWTRAYRRVFQEIENDVTRESRAASQRYVTRLLQPSEPDAVAAVQERSLSKGDSAVDEVTLVGTYALGTQRSLAAYQKHIGVDFPRKQVLWAAQWGHLDPIRFELSTKASAEHAPA